MKTVTSPSALKRAPGKRKTRTRTKSISAKECTVSCSRSYYVGDDIERENVKAKYDNGMLTLTVPKSQPKQLPSHNIEIE